MTSPEAFADLLLSSNPTAWPGRREEARARFVEWLALSEGCTKMVLLPAWLTHELPKTFPPE